MRVKDIDPRLIDGPASGVVDEPMGLLKAARMDR